MFLAVSDNLKKLSKFFPENLYIVGGYVRNAILGLEYFDVDLTSSVDVDEVSKRLKDSGYSVKIKNLKLGTILITKDDEVYEYTAFRKESYKGGEHVPYQIERTDKIEEDAVRRDFTINTIYYNINKDEIVDLYHGIVDIAQKVIRCNISPDEVFKNDGERILRMIRIAGELNFKIDKATLKGAKKYVSNLSEISGNRKLLEIQKILNCDQRFKLNKKGLKKSLNLLNGVWLQFGLKNNIVKYDMVYKCSDRFLGLLIDIIDTEKPECLEAFLETFLKEQFGFNSTIIKKIFIFLSGYYDALNGMSNKEYFFKYFENWGEISLLLRCKSKHTQSKYNFFYKYIIEHGLTIRIEDLKINEDDIKKNFKNIDKRSYNRILNNLLSKVFDGKLQNDKNILLDEIEKNLQNY